MMRMYSIKVITALVVAFTAASALAAGSSGTAAAPLISTKTNGEVAIVPEAMVNGGLMFKIVAVNRTLEAVHFGPKDIQVFTAAGKAVPLMRLDELIAQARRSSSPRSESYGPSGLSGPTVSRNMAGQPNLDNFAGGDTMSGEITPQRSGDGPESPAVKRQVANLRAAILQNVVIAPGALKGGEVVTRPIRFSRHGKRTLRVEINLNGERHEFTFAAPPGR